LLLDQFKTYEELDKRLNYVLGKGAVSPRPSSADEEEEYESYVPKASKEDNVMKELEESYLKSKSSPPVPAAMKEELNNLSSSSSGDEDEDDAHIILQ